MAKKDFRVEKINDTYYLIDNNSDYKEACTLWYEKKTDKFHVKLPKDNPSGRTYVRQEIVDEKGYYEFDKKTEFRTLSGGGWKNRMTDEEKTEYEQLEKRLDEIKEIAMSRPVPKVDKNSEEYIQSQINKLMEKLNSIKN